MAEIVDILNTVFKTSGLQNIIFSMTAAENATDRLANAQARLAKAQAGGNQYSIDLAQRRLNVSQRHLMEANFTEAAAAATPYLHVLNRIVATTKEIVDATAKFGTEVMNLKAISGGSGTEAAGILNLGKGSGGSGTAKMLANLNKVVFSGEGQGALQQLGISPRQGESTIDLALRIKHALNLMTDGFYKQRIEQKLGMEDQQEFLRLSDDAAQKLRAFGDVMDNKALKTIQRWNEANGVLGVGLDSIKQKIGIDFMTVLTPLIDTINELIDTWRKFDKAVGGAGSWAVVFGIMLVGIGMAAAGIYKLIRAMAALGVITKAQIVLTAVLDALEGNWAAIAAAVAIGAGAAIWVNSLTGGEDKGQDKVDEFGRHVDNFGDTVGQFRDMWGQGGKAIPSGMSANDVAHLFRMQAMGAIG